jgi:hypothetical protein
MMNYSERIFGTHTEHEFDKLALDLFRETVRTNPVYRSFIGLLHVPFPEHYGQIPFMPIGFFKTRQVLAEELSPQRTFLSSGTSGMERSRHFVADLALYDRSLLEGFRHFYGDPSGYAILALTPTPSENPDSSLVYMINRLVSFGKHSRFLPLKDPGLEPLLVSCNERGGHVMIIGLTWALLDLPLQGPVPDSSLIVVETGGMKGRRKEITRAEVHELLKAKFGVDKIHSEYSMSELLSQSWSQGDGIFRCPPWMKVLIREVNDPLTLAAPGQTGGICIIDLANRYSCPFIATEDLGRLNNDGSFEVLGRFDHSEMRGCSLMAD